jgi:hypothetical protein
MSPVDGILLLKVVEDRVGSEGRGVHGCIKRRLEMLMVIAKCIQQENDFDLVKVDRSHVGDPCMHGKNFISTITEQCLTAIMEVESLLEQKELGMCAKFLMALLELSEDEV